VEAYVLARRRVLARFHYCGKSVVITSYHSTTKENKQWHHDLTDVIKVPVT